MAPPRPHPVDTTRKLELARAGCSSWTRSPNRSPRGTLCAAAWCAASSGTQLFLTAPNGDGGARARVPRSPSAKVKGARQGRQGWLTTLPVQNAIGDDMANWTRDDIDFDEVRRRFPLVGRGPLGVPRSQPTAPRRRPDPRARVLAGP